MVQTLKNLPAMQETWVPSLDWEDPLEKGMATHSSILAWRIQWTEKSGRLQSMGSQRVGMAERLSTSPQIRVLASGSIGKRSNPLSRRCISLSQVNPSP